MQQKIEDCIRARFSIEMLEIQNDSAAHQGHAGDNGTGQTHFSITIKATELIGVSRVNAQRKVNEAVAHLFDQGLHALSTKIIV